MIDTVSAPAAKRQRPLSPHLQIYKPQITSITSILHRLTGIALSFGVVLLVLWLASAANGIETYEQMQNFLRSPLGLVMLAGWSWSLFYHLANGIRHLFWDIGWGYDIPTMTASGYAVLASATVATVLVWVLGFMMAGGQ
mgnify:CR=1 FL=1